MLTTLYDSFLAVAYPQNCKICRKDVESYSDGNICSGCWGETRIFCGNEVLCQKCGAFLKEGKYEFEAFCRKCDDDTFDRASAVGLYEKALMACVLNLKQAPHIPAKLNNLFFTAFTKSFSGNIDQIIPVPLSRKRMHERGFNQSLILAEALPEKTGVPINASTLIRKVHTEKNRAGMDKKAREETVKDAFKVRNASSIEGRSLLLVDDVFTSGATVSSAARVLKDAGADKVFVLTIARAL